MVKFNPDKDRPDPDALMYEIKTFNLHLETTKANVQDISNVAKKSEEMKLVFPLTITACRSILTAPVTVAKVKKNF